MDISRWRIRRNIGAQNSPNPERAAERSSGPASFQGAYSHRIQYRWFYHRLISAVPPGLKMAPCGLLLLAFAAVTTIAQENQQAACRCSVPESFAAAQGKKLGFITVRVKAQLNTAASRLEWVLQEFPRDDQISIADAGLREKIRNQIAALESQRPACGFGGNCRFDEILNGQNNDVDLSVVLPPELEEAPADPNQTFECSLCVLYRPASVAPSQPFRVEIHVKTAMGATLTQKTCAMLGQAPAQANRSGAARALAVKLAFAAEDIQNAKKDPQISSDEDARRRVTEELLAVADRAFDIAAANRMIDADGKALIACPTDPAAQQVAQNVIVAIRDVYDLNRRDSGVSWGRFGVAVFPCNIDSVCSSAPQTAGCDNLCGDSQQPAWIILISGLQIVRSVSVKAAPDEIDRQFTRTATGRSLYRKRKEAEAELNEKFRDRFSAKPGHIVTIQDVGSDERLMLDEIKEFKGLRSRPYLPPASTRKPDFTTNTNLIYEVLRKLPADRAIGLKGGGGYSPEEKFTANIGLDEQNMLRLGEQAALDFARGPETQRAQLTLSRQFAETGRAGFRLKSVSVNAQYFRDNDQRLGNLTAEEIAAREAGSQAKYTFGYDSFSAQDRANAEFVSDDRKRTHWTMLGDVALEYRDVNIPASDRLLTITGLDRILLPAARTQITNLALSITAGVTRDFRRSGRAGLGLIALSLNTRLQRGMNVFGGDYDYGKAWLSARGEVFFGRLTAQDFFLRYTQGIGRGSDRTPVFELFRLGGPQNLRGVEEGELIGRRLSFGQAEFGVSALSLWHFIRGRRAAQSQPQADNAASNNSGEERQTGGGFDFSNVYLKTFFDHARITDPTSFSSAPGAARSFLDRRANGAGFAFELRNLPAGAGGQRLNLSIGYARSPQSRLHRSGTMFTAVTFNF